MTLPHMLRGYSQKPAGRMTVGGIVIASGIFLFAVGAFIYLAVQVAGGNTLGHDDGVLLGINSTATPPLDNIVVGLTSLGDMLAVGALSAALLGILALRKRWLDFWQVTLVMTSAVLLNAGLKLSFARERPQLWQQIIFESSYSFPSGHAMMTGAFAMLLILLAWKSRYRWSALVICLAYMGAIGFSRLYLGVHYPTDVLAGWCVSIALVTGVFVLLRTVPVSYLLK